MDWTTRQEELLRQYCHLGARGVQAALLHECGVGRSIRAIEAKASRNHVSLKKRTVCPECGTIGVRLNRQTGLCKLCTERQHVEEERAFNAILEEERLHSEESEELAELKREYARLRQRNSRLRRRYGLKSTRER